MDRLAGPARALVTAVTVGSCLAFAQSAAALDQEWTRRWREDLETVRVEIPKVHANAFHTMSRQEWDAALDTIESRLPTLEHHQVVVELATLIAAIGDGHTRLTLPVDPGFGRAVTHTPTPEPKDPALQFHFLPIRMYLYADGLHVREIDAAHAAYAGAKVVRIGTMTTEEALAAVAPTVQRDNDQQVAARSPIHLMIPEVLHALGITPDPRRASFELETVAGAREVVTLDAVPFHQPVTWAGAGPSGAPPPYLRDTETKFWTVDLPDLKAVYVRINEIQDMDGETYSDFADRLFDAFDAGPATRMIIDLRNNPGGDNTLNRNLVHRVICSAKLKKPGSLFVVIDRGTFSAAMNLVTKLEQHSTALFIGEPTGASPNGYGDSRKTELPNTGLTIRSSTLYWQTSDPRDERPSTEPHLLVPLTSKDEAAGRDPVLATLTDLWSRPCDPGGTWSGVATYRFWRFPLTLEVTKSDRGWEGRLTCEALEIDHVPVAITPVDARTVSFDIPSPFGGMLPTTAWLGGNAMVGAGESGGRVLILSLQR